MSKNNLKKKSYNNLIIKMSGYFASAKWPNHGVLCHGGVLQAMSTKPISDLNLYTPESNFENFVCLDSSGPKLRLSRFTNVGKRSLIYTDVGFTMFANNGNDWCLFKNSHHAACILADNLFVIGGWTGEIRTSQVWVFELKKKKWSKLIEDKNGDARCDPPVGLSGHTATAVNSKLICVIGREGGVRIQRRFGQMYFLHFDVSKSIYWYSEAPMLLQSRSGHSTILSPPSKGFFDLLIFGGRNSGLLDVLGRWSTKDVENDFTEIHDEIRKTLKLEALTQPMIGLRYHSMLSLTPECFLIHGGRHFKGISSKNINGQLYAGIRQHPFSKCVVKWYKVITSDVMAPRFAHTMAVIENEIYTIGGFEKESDKKPAPVKKLLNP